MDDIKLLPGVYRGIVKDANDPQKLNRVKVELQTNFGYTTNWVWPINTPNVDFSTPKVGQGVWVMFNGADPEHPVWLGTYGTYLGSEEKGNKDIFKIFIGAFWKSNLFANPGIEYYFGNNLFLLPDGTQHLALVRLCMDFAAEFDYLYNTVIPDLQSQIDTLSGRITALGG